MKPQNDQIIDPNPFSKLTELHTLRSHMGRITAINICEQKNLLVSGSLDKTVKIWNFKDGTLLKTFQFSDLIYDVVLSSEGHFIACGGGNSLIVHLIEIKDLRCNDIVSDLKGHSDIVQSLYFSNDQIYLISGSYDCTVRVWGVQMKQELCKFEAGSTPQSLTMSRDIRLMVSHTWGKGIKIWDFKIKKLLCSQKGHSKGNGITFSNNEQQLISSGDDGKIRIWSLSVLYQSKLSLIKTFKSANQQIEKVLMTSDSRFIVFYCYKNRKVIVIDSNNGQQVKYFEFQNLSEYSIIFFDFGSVTMTKQIDMVAYGDGQHLILQTLVQ